MEGTQHAEGTSKNIMLTPYSMVWDWRSSRAGTMLFIGLSCSIPTRVFYYFSISLLSVYLGWYCGAGVFGLIKCISLSVSLALPTSFNNNNKNWLRARNMEINTKILVWTAGIVTNCMILTSALRNEGCKSR